MRGKEIELKYLIGEVPELNPISVERIVQYYIKVEKEEEIRYRAIKSERFYKTIKKGKGLVREEIEAEVTEEEYESNKVNMVGKDIQKLRCKIPYQVGKREYIIELDIYEKEHKGLVVAEVEFKSILESTSFKYFKPLWFGEEVTENPKYKNKNLALSK